MNYTTCPVYDCCGGTIIRDNGMRARCRTCDGRGVVEAPRVTVTHEGPPVVTPALGEVIVNGRAYQTGWDDGIREGERRMLWLVAIAAEWERFLVETKMLQAGVAPFCQGIDRGYRNVCESALHALDGLGDEDASRVLGERGW